MIAQTIAVLTIIFIGITLFPEIQRELDFNLDTEFSVDKDFLNIIPYVFTGTVILIAIAIALKALSGTKEEEEEEEEISYEPKVKPKDQSYKDYVKERLEIERMMKE